jgi:glutamate-1-semialdehyde 2,1-aminomutase
MSSAAVTSPRLEEQFSQTFAQSRRLYEQARGIFPDGVTHDLRRLEPFPIYIDHAAGSRKWTVEDRELIDYWSGHGALLLGHCHPAVVAAVQRQAARATHPGGCHEGEIEWGQWVQRLLPSAERVRFVSSGTEATLMALRLARLYTGRPRVLKLAGHFHGWHDFLMHGADAPHASPVPGVPADVAQNTVVVPPNDLGAVERALQGDAQIGCVILEPTGGHWGAVPIRGTYLHGLRELTALHGRLLIFDEVITGFRVSPSGAQGHYGIRPDLTTLAKIVAGGLPGGCVAGRADILAAIETRPGKAKMRHPGTFNANPLSAAAGVATLQLVASGEPCRRATDMAILLRRLLNDLFAERGARWVAYGEFSCFKLLAGYDGPRPDDDSFIPCGGDLERLDAPPPAPLRNAFRQAMLLSGVDLPGLGGFTTAAHSEEDVARTVETVATALDRLRGEGVG